MKKEGVGYHGTASLCVNEFEGEVELTFTLDGTNYALRMDEKAFEALEVHPSRNSKKVGGLIE